MKSCPFPTGNTLHKIWCDARWLIFENESRLEREFLRGTKWSEYHLQQMDKLGHFEDEPMAFNRIKGRDQADIDRLVCGQEFIDDGQRVSPLDMQRKEGDRFMKSIRGE